MRPYFTDWAFSPQHLETYGLVCLVLPRSLGYPTWFLAYQAMSGIVFLSGSQIKSNIVWSLPQFCTTTVPTHLQAVQIVGQRFYDHFSLLVFCSLIFPHQKDYNVGGKAPTWSLHAQWAVWMFSSSNGGLISVCGEQTSTLTLAWVVWRSPQDRPL